MTQSPDAEKTITHQEDCILFGIWRLSSLHMLGLPNSGPATDNGEDQGRIWIMLKNNQRMQIHMFWEPKFESWPHFPLLFSCTLLKRSVVSNLVPWPPLLLRPLPLQSPAWTHASRCDLCVWQGGGAPSCGLSRSTDISGCSSRRGEAASGRFHVPPIFDLSAQVLAFCFFLPDNGSQHQRCNWDSMYSVLVPPTTCQGFRSPIFHSRSAHFMWQSLRLHPLLLPESPTPLTHILLYFPLPA